MPCSGVIGTLIVLPFTSTSTSTFGDGLFVLGRSWRGIINVKC